MSWLRNHFHFFVYPALWASVQANGTAPAPVEFSWDIPKRKGVLSTAIGSPFEVKENPLAPKSMPSELRKLWSLCKDLGVPWSSDVRESSEYGGTSFARKGAKIHDKILRSTLQSSIVAMKAEGCDRLLLAGRDVWALAILAERKSVPYVFIPEISRRVAGDAVAIRELLGRYNYTGKELLVDTGFMGSIPKKISEAMGANLKFRLMSQNDKWEAEKLLPPKPFRMRVRRKRGPYGPPLPSLLASILSEEDAQKANEKAKADLKAYWEARVKLAPAFRPEQLFPNRKDARKEALETEYLAKYWKTGTVDNGKAIQYLSDPRNIQRAAVLTSLLWRGLDGLTVESDADADPKPSWM